MEWKFSPLNLNCQYFLFLKAKYKTFASPFIKKEKKTVDVPVEDKVFFFQDKISMA